MAVVRVLTPYPHFKGPDGWSNISGLYNCNCCDRAKTFVCSCAIALGLKMTRNRAAIMAVIPQSAMEVMIGRKRKVGRPKKIKAAWVFEANYNLDVDEEHIPNFEEETHDLAHESQYAAQEEDTGEHQYDDEEEEDEVKEAPPTMSSLSSSSSSASSSLASARPVRVAALGVATAVTAVASGTRRRK